ncbi:MAG: thiamine-phosphate kinase, partial [Methanotrichaceae archaeon]
MKQKCRDLGERQLIQTITSILGIAEKDDCAIMDAGDRYLVWTTDMLHRETDFPEVATPWQIGWMTAAVNLSDIAAMGAEPMGLLIATGIPPDTEIDFVEDIFSGLRDCARVHGTEILGGDLDSHQELTLTGSALGWVEKELVLRRRGAKPGDLLCTTGFLGSAGAGLKLVFDETEYHENELVKRLLEPDPCLKEGRALARSRTVTAMIDNSDGLVLSLFDLSVASRVGFVVQEESLPIDPKVSETAENKADQIDLALHAGGDFGLVFTIMPDKIDLARQAC